MISSVCHCITIGISMIIKRMYFSYQLDVITVYIAVLNNLLTSNVRLQVRRCL